MTITAPVRIGGKRFVLHDVSWKTYESLLRQLSRKHLFLTYYRGTLELMAPSFFHGSSSLLIGILIHTMAQEAHVPVRSAGTTTFRRRDLKVGLEADEAFYFKNAAAVRGLKEIDLAVTPPPDLVVETEISRRLGKRKLMYARLGVPKVWQYNGDRLRVSVLQSNGKYKEFDRSPTFPFIELAEIIRFVRMGGEAADEGPWVMAFREYIRNLL